MNNREPWTKEQDKALLNAMSRCKERGDLWLDVELRKARPNVTRKAAATRAWRHKPVYRQKQSRPKQPRPIEIQNNSKLMRIEYGEIVIVAPPTIAIETAINVVGGGK